MGLAWDLKAHFFMRTKLAIQRVKKISLKKIKNFEPKGIIEKCVSCFFVYSFYGSLFFLKKRYYGTMVKFLYKTLQQLAVIYTTVGGRINLAARVE